MPNHSYEMLSEVHKANCLPLSSVKIHVSCSSYLVPASPLQTSQIPWDI